MRNSPEIRIAERGLILTPCSDVLTHRGRSKGVNLGVLMAAVLLSLAAAASAEDPPARPARMNVFISPSGEPFRAAPGQPYPVDDWFNRADTNHDGALSLDEFVADAESFFRKLDANHDGVIDGFELTDYEQKVAPEILPRVGGLTARDIPPLPRERPENGRIPEPQEQQEQPQREPEEKRHSGPPVVGAAVFGLIREPEPVAAADADFDGKITLAEMTAAARRRFAELDLDHDGRLTRAELPKTPIERLAEKGERKRHERHR
jgi:hypothetical protein